jgi:hypothetical protein
MRGKQGTDPYGGSTLFSLWDCMEELSKIVHRGRKHHLIIGTAGQLKDWYPKEVTDDLDTFIKSYLGLSLYVICTPSALKLVPQTAYKHTT